MKTVNTSRTRKDAKEIYKVGNVIYDGVGYYLVVTSNGGYALIDLSNNNMPLERDSLSELVDAAWDDSDRLVDVELRILA